MHCCILHDEECLDEFIASTVEFPFLDGIVSMESQAAMFEDNLQTGIAIAANMPPGQVVPHQLQELQQEHMEVESTLYKTDAVLLSRCLMLMCLVCWCWLQEGCENCRFGQRLP